MKERSPPGLVVAYSVGSAIWHLIFGGRASSGSTSKLHRQSSIPHSFSTGELAKFSDTGLSHIADLADELELDGNFEELLGNSLAIALDVFKANWFLCTKMTLG